MRIFKSETEFGLNIKTIVQNKKAFKGKICSNIVMLVIALHYYKMVVFSVIELCLFKKGIVRKQKKNLVQLFWKKKLNAQNFDWSI